ncbi:MAG: type I restriction enzyme HsdR N-terminal domain-containing protein [Candidatus Marinimicrobia bacterium]|nr:type I restriction enzyme HsdR N-terminal domain-containing protein [Candidatus Neomarinimicrobiota bacterium]MBL7023310.1 type I restriction enzyme HsdR N-terminal domain-containing protein [Candidatus Neomarinimicrobiota bacterium]
MNEILLEIREFIKKGYFLNEENVRFSLVSRILQELGWNIWNPKEVATEFNTVPNEDKSRVDVALFDNSPTPSVFVEIKAMGKLDFDLAKHEVQLRDYNRNNTAPFSIITDGQLWRFYYSQTGGEFSQKCFKIIDLLKDELDDIELSFYAFLSKEEIRSGNAKNEAETYLTLSQKQRSMEDAVSEARRQVLEPPFPSLPEAIISIVEKDGYKVSIDEASRFVKKQGAKKQKTELPKITIQVKKPIRKVNTQSSGYTGKKVSAFKFNNQTYEVRFWIDVLCRISQILHQTHRSDFTKVLTLHGRKRPYYTKDESLLRVPQIIEGTDVFVEANLSSNTIVKLCHDVVALFGYTKTDLKMFSK